MLSIALALMVALLIGIALHRRYGGKLWFRKSRHHDFDDELIPSNRNWHAVEYTEADFPCPPSMPGKRTTIGSHFCDIESKPGEVAFAVVRPEHTATPIDLQAIGERLEAWKAGNDQVRRILGLNQLLEGKHPTVKAGMFSLDCGEDHVHVSMIYVTSQADNETTGEQLLQAMKGLPVEVCSPAYFSKLRE